MAEKKKTERKSPAPSVPAEQFVQTWQKCDTLADAKKSLGDGCGSRAARLRKAGVKLKVMPGGARKVDVAALNKLIGA